MKKILEIIINSLVFSLVVFLLGICVKYIFFKEIVFDFYLIPAYFVFSLCIKYIISNKSEIKLSGKDTQISIGKNNKQKIN